MAENNELRVANKKDVWHLIQKGVLTQLHFDFEAYGLNSKFTQIQSYGDAVGDIAGNFSHSKEFDVKRPDRYLPTPEALAVVKTSPKALDDKKRWPHRVAMAAIAQRFEENVMTAQEFGVSDGGRWLRTARRKGGDLYHKSHYEEVIHYPLFDPEGQMEVLEDGTVVSDPPGMLKLNDKGEIVIGPDEKTVTVPHKVRLKQPDGKYEDTVVYKPMKPEDGKINFDVRIHPERNRISYRFDEDPHSDYYEFVENNYYEDAQNRDQARGKAALKSDKWKFSEARLAVSGYRIKWYDIPVFRPNLVRAGFHPQNIFFTQSKSTISKKQLPKNYPVDAYSTYIRTCLEGPQGEEGMKLGERVDPRTGEKVSSAKLELGMSRNSRYENKQRGVRAGVFMPDGSLYDPLKGHKNPYYDAQASFAIYNYSREIAPDLVKSMEMQADEDYLRELLPGRNLIEDHPPVFAMMRGNYPEKPEIDPIVFVGFDDQQGQLRRAITVRLDLGDLQNYRYNGKTLAQMAQEDSAESDPAKWNFVRMMKEQGRGSNALVRVDSLRKFHGVSPIQDVMHTENARNWDVEQIDDNFRFVSEKGNSEILDAIRNAAEVMNWEMRQDPLPANPRLEEQWPFNSFGDIDFLEYEAREEKVKRKKLPREGQTKGIVQTLYEKAMDVFKYHNAIDELLHRLAIQPHPVDLYGYDKTLDVDAAIDNYKELFRKVYRRLDDKDCPYVHIFDEFKDHNDRLMPPSTIEQIQDFRWKLMKRMLKDDELERNDRRSEYHNGLFDHEYSKKGRILFGNVSRDFRIVDERGRELPIDYLKQQYTSQPNEVLKKLEAKEWKIQFYRQTSEPTTSVILMQFADMGRLNELPEIWQFRYKALRALYLNGRPNEDSTNMSWDAIPALERSLLAMETNHPMEDDNEKSGISRVFSNFVSGEAEIFLRSEEGRRFLGEYREFLEKIKKENPFLDEYKQAMGYDPVTNLPYDWIEDEIDESNHVVIDVPDPHLRDPLEDIRQAPYSLVIGDISEADRKKVVHQRVPVVLRGMQTGRLYHPGPVNLTKAPKETASYADYYEEAQRAYEEEAGVPFPKADERYVMRVGELEPVGNNRYVDPTMQAFKVPSQHFDGLVSPRLAYFNDDQPLTGLVLPADYCPQEVKAGKPVRFREMKASMGSKMNGVEGIETGHMYETTLRKARRITVGKLMDEISAGKITDEQAQRCGYAGAHDMYEKVNAAFLNRESQDRMNEEVLMLEFDPVDKETWAFDPPFESLKAAFTRNGQPVPPVRTIKPSNDNRGKRGRKKAGKGKEKVVVPEQPAEAPKIPEVK